jgi:PAS domain S-box-containing protein
MSYHILIILQGIIQDVVGSVHELYGYRRHDVVGKNVRKLVPVWQKMESHDSGYAENVSEISEKLMNFDQINNIKFFGSISKYGVCFPIITKARQIPESYKDKVPNATNIIKIISLPTVRIKNHGYNHLSSIRSFSYLNVLSDCRLGDTTC